MTILTRTWVLLMALTVLSLLAGRPGTEGSIGLLGNGLVLMAANFKADQILTPAQMGTAAGAGYAEVVRLEPVLRAVDRMTLGHEGPAHLIAERDLVFC